MDKREKILNCWLEYIGEPEQEAPALAKVLEHFSNEELARPFVVRDLKKEVPTKIICKRYGLTPDTVRGIGLRANVRFSRRRYRRQTVSFSFR